MKYDYEVEHAKRFVEWCKKNNLEISVIDTAEATLKYWQGKAKERS